MQHKIDELSEKTKTKTKQLSFFTLVVIYDSGIALDHPVSKQMHLCSSPVTG